MYLLDISTNFTHNYTYSCAVKGTMTATKSGDHPHFLWRSSPQKILTSGRTCPYLCSSFQVGIKRLLRTLFNRSENACHTPFLTFNVLSLTHETFIHFFATFPYCLSALVRAFAFPATLQQLYQRHARNPVLSGYLPV
jgi:hypothetical protein